MRLNIKHCLLAFIISFPLTGTAQTGVTPSADKNYILTLEPRTGVTDAKTLSSSSCMQTVQYFDDWGRDLQAVQKGITPQGADLVTYQEYDAMGNPNKAWLPVKMTGNMGKFVSLTSLSSNSSSVYGGDRYAYSLDVFENSPLNRIIEKYAPGGLWVGDPTGYNYTYEILSSASICHYTAVNGSNDTIVNIKLSGMYATGDLLVENISNEDYNTTKVYTDKEGRRVMEEKNGHCTYYVYDDRSRLRAVLPPQLSAVLTAAGSSWSNASSNLLRQYAYLYSYDGQNRCSHKRLPGTSWTYLYYDKSGQLILSQDGNQRNRSECTFTIPDGNGRTVLSGICKNVCSLSSNSLQNSIVRATRNNQTDSNKGYNISGITLSSPVMQIVNYYDDYSFMGKNNVPASTNSVLSYEAVSGYGIRYTENPVGFQTGQIVRLTDGNYIYKAMYYDERGRLVQSHSTNHLGGSERMWYTYNFTGEVTKSKHIHTATGKNSQTEIYDYGYDHGGRLTSMYHQLGANIRTQLLSCSYDELGRLSSRKVHGLSSSSLSYMYNIRNWLLKIDGSLFKETLYYTGNEPYSSPFGSYSNSGNICGMTWQSGNESVLRGYELYYDKLDRLITAEYSEGTSMNQNANRYTEQVTSYDRNGNILGLKRYGQTGASTYGLIDNLTYTLNGNQLKSVNDAVTASAYNGGFEFKNGSSAAVEYTYDANGNLSKDLNKGITGIEYNFLNLPSKVTFSDGSTITYTYAADGTKLKTVHKIGSTTTTTDYCGNVINENGTQKLLLTEEGYVTLNNNQYHYYLKDHQGNNRVVINQSGTVEETNHYYPFGGIFAATGNTQPYKYNGKELDTKKGLNWYDYGARHYDAALGRFHTNDSFSEKYYSMSPYQYGANNPVNNIDINGDSIVTTLTTEIGGKMKNVTYTYRQNPEGSYGFYDASGNTYSGDNQYMENLTNALSSLRKGKVGNSLVDELMNSSNTVNIANRERNGADPNGTYVTWNPLNVDGGIDETGSRTRPAFIALGHEMAHIQDVWRGTYDNTMWVKGVRNAEKYATHVENQLRSEHGLSLRTHYGILSTGIGDPQTPLLRKGTGVSLYYRRIVGIGGVYVPTTPYIY